MSLKISSLSLEFSRRHLFVNLPFIGQLFYSRSLGLTVTRSWEA